MGRELKRKLLPDQKNKKLPKQDTRSDTRTLTASPLGPFSLTGWSRLTALTAVNRNYRG
jgi:hypothetical protein